MNYTWILYSILALIASSFHTTNYKYLTAINLPLDLCTAVNIALAGFIAFLYIIFNLDRLDFNKCKIGIKYMFFIALCIIIFNFCLVTAIKYSTNTSFPLIIINLNIILTALLSYFLFKEKISKEIFFGIILIIIGLSMVIYYLKNESKLY